MRVLALGVLALSAVFFMQEATAQQLIPQSRAICITAVEFKGSTTTDKLAPPDMDPATMSKASVQRTRAGRSVCPAAMRGGE
jgi:hypothetical protein